MCLTFTNINRIITVGIIFLRLHYHKILNIEFSYLKLVETIYNLKRKTSVSQLKIARLQSYTYPTIKAADTVDSVPLKVRLILLTLKCIRYE